MDSKLSVRLYGIPIGVLEKTSGKKLYFSYKNDILENLSFSMPLKEKTFDNHLCQTYFGGLLPTKEMIREQLAYQYGCFSNDTFSFLANLGKECMGAISFHLLSDPVNFEEESFFKARILSDTDLKASFISLGSEPLFYRHYEKYPMLSGDSTKAAICFAQNNIAIPVNNGFSTHILKIHESEEQLLNQYYCLKMAHYAGLKIPEYFLTRVAERLVLIFSRYDREVVGKQIKKYHQEDACQALGILSSKRYQRDQGPSFKDIFNIVNHSRIPAYDRHRLMQRVLFNFVINNTKAHGKHFSFLRMRPNYFVLAPMNGLFSDYEQREPLAMSIGNKATIENVTGSDWCLLCKQIGYTASLFKIFRKEYAKILIQAAEQVLQDFKKEGLDLGVAKRITEFVRHNSYRMEQ